MNHQNLTNDSQWFIIPSDPITKSKAQSFSSKDPISSHLNWLMVFVSSKYARKMFALANFSFLENFPFLYFFKIIFSNIFLYKLYIFISFLENFKYKL